MLLRLLYPACVRSVAMPIDPANSDAASFHMKASRVQPSTAIESGVVSQAKVSAKPAAMNAPANSAHARYLMLPPCRNGQYAE